MDVRKTHMISHVLGYLRQLGNILGNWENVTRYSLFCRHPAPRARLSSQIWWERIRRSSALCWRSTRRRLADPHCDERWVGLCRFVWKWGTGAPWSTHESGGISWYTHFQAYPVVAPFSAVFLKLPTDQRWSAPSERRAGKRRTSMRMRKMKTMRRRWLWKGSLNWLISS